MIYLVLGVVGAVATHCTPGLKYCGNTLLDMGAYTLPYYLSLRALILFEITGYLQLEQLTQNAYDNKLDVLYTHNFLYLCVEDHYPAIFGTIKFLRNCATSSPFSYCSSNGKGNNDSCEGQSAEEKVVIA